MSRWKRVADKNVRTIWRCRNGQCEDVVVPTTFFEENGTPVCGCDEDMFYVKTEVCTTATKRKPFFGGKPEE